MMLVMVFSAKKMRKKFPELNFEFIWMVLILILIVPNFNSLYPRKDYCLALISKRPSE